MNTPNNKRARATEKCLKNTLMALLKDKELADISVTELCEAADIDRSTFYAHDEDVAALGNACAADIEKQLSEVSCSADDFTWIFEYIKEHPDVFSIYFRLGVSKTNGDYKKIFFRTGSYSVAKMWFDGGCEESPAQMGEIVKREYRKLFSVN